MVMLFSIFGFYFMHNIAILNYNNYNLCFIIVSIAFLIMFLCSAISSMFITKNEVANYNK